MDAQKPQQPLCLSFQVIQAAIALSVFHNFPYAKFIPHIPRAPHNFFVPHILPYVVNAVPDLMSCCDIHKRCTIPFYKKSAISHLAKTSDHARLPLSFNYVGWLWTLSLALSDTHSIHEHRHLHVAAHVSVPTGMATATEKICPRVYTKLSILPVARGTRAFFEHSHAVRGTPPWRNSPKNFSKDLVKLHSTSLR